MNEEIRTDKTGGIIISNEVIASIAQSAAKEIEGFGGFAQRPSEIVSKTLKPSETYKAIRIWSSDSDIKIHIFMNIKEGYQIQKVCSEIQQSVKNNVQSMTGRAVSKVNITVDGISFETTK